MSDHNTTEADAPVEAPTEDSPAQGASAPSAPALKTTKSRGTLEAETLAVCNDFVTGLLVLEEGQMLTPSTISRVIHARNGNVGNPPSSGAIADNLTRWAAIGFCTVNDKPKAFVDYTDEGRDKGLTALKAEARAAKVAAAAPVSAPATSAPVENDEPVEASAPVEADEQATASEMFVQSTAAVEDEQDDVAPATERQPW
ncbi:MAG: hypothetical protein AB7O86_05580 [Porticoccaceae bacterium]